MKKFMIHIKSDTPEEIKEELRELSFIMCGLRESTKKWQLNYGALNRNEMKRWEEKADAWLNKHKSYYNADN